MNQMERELTAWLARGLWRRPWMGVAWLTMIGLAWILPLSHRYINLGGSDRVSLYGLEAALLWILAGGVFGFRALGEIEPALSPRAPRVRWRVRGAVFLLLQGVPAIPCLLPVLIFAPPGRGGYVLGIAALILAQSVLLASVIAALPWMSIRPLLFLAVTWWVPALIPETLPLGADWLAQISLHGIETGNIDDSPLWFGWVGSMLALTCLAFALDYARRPAT